MIECRAHLGSNTDLDSNHLCLVEQAFLDKVEHALSTMLYKPGAGVAPSSAVRASIRNVAIEENWHRGLPVVPDLPPGENLTNFRFDWTQVSSEFESCGHRHLINLENSFDNRQAIGTVLLKAELAQRGFSSRENFLSLAVLICTDSRMKKTYGWDNSVGTSEDYEFSLREPYRDLLAPRLVIVTIRDLPQQ